MERFLGFNLLMIISFLWNHQEMKMTTKNIYRENFSLVLFISKFKKKEKT